MHVIYRSPVYTPLFLAGVCMLYICVAMWRARGGACVLHASLIPPRSLSFASKIEPPVVSRHHWPAALRAG